MNNLNIILNNNLPFYIQIYNYIKENIINNIFKENEKLPSKRKLSLDLNVSVNTIINAYNMLLDEGYIYSLSKKGFYVNSINIVNTHVKINTLKENHISYKYDLTCENVNKNSFPLSTFIKCAKNSLNECSFLNRSALSGNSLLKNEIKNMLYIKKNMNVDNNQIFISNGSKNIINHLINFFNVKKIAVEDPGFYNEQYSNIKFDYINVDNEGFSASSFIKSNDKLAIITSSSQFPLGIKMSTNRKNELCEYIKNKDIYIIEDAFDSAFRNQGYFSTPLFNLSNNVIYLESFSRTMFPGLNISFAVLPKKISKDFTIYLNKAENPISNMDQLILANFIKDNYYDRHVNKLRINYLNIKKELKNILLKSDKIISINDLNYSSLIIKYTSNKTEDELKKYFEKNSIKINFLSKYCHYNIIKDMLIIGFTNIDKTDLFNIVNNILNYL